MGQVKYKSDSFSDSKNLLDAVSKLDSESMEYSWSLEQWKNAANSEAHYRLGQLFDGDTLIGFSFYAVSYEQSHLLKIAVSQPLRKQGYASILLKNDIQRLKQIDVSEIYLEVSIKNTAAISFYQNHEFKILTLKKNFYSDGTDANAMGLQLK